MAILVFACALLDNAFCQDKLLIPNRQNDSVWIQNCFRQKQKEYSARDTLLTFTKGIVYYSPDKLFKFGKIIANYSYTDGSGEESFSFHYIQYHLKNKFVNVEIDDSISFNIQPKHKIYKLPYKVPAYLVINAYAETEEYVYFSTRNLPSDESNFKFTETNAGSINNKNQNKAMSRFLEPEPETTKAGTELYFEDGPQTDENIHFSAYIITINKENIGQLGFPLVPDYPRDADTGEHNETEDYTEYTFTSKVFSDKKLIQPHLTYDASKKQLNYRYLVCNNSKEENCNEPYFKTYAGTLVFRDSTFHSIRDSAWYYPPLESFKVKPKVNSDRKDFNICHINMQAVAITKDEEIGEGTIPVSHVYYKIGKNKIDNYNQVNTDDDTIGNINNPIIKIQDDTSFILQINNVSTPNMSGRCGGCMYDDTQFWLIQKDSVENIFSYSGNTDSNLIEYNLNGIDSTFYLYNDPEKNGETTLDSTYWKDNHTYVLRFSDGNVRQAFYIHFDKKGNKAVPRIEKGEIEKAEKRRFDF